MPECFENNLCEFPIRTQRFNFEEFLYANKNHSQTWYGELNSISMQGI